MKKRNNRLPTKHVPEREEYWNNLKAQIEMEDKVALKEEHCMGEFRDPKAQMLRRTIGLLMAAFCSLGLFVGVIFYIAHILYVQNIPLNLSSRNPFPNPYNLILPLPFILMLELMTFFGIYCGVKMVKKPQSRVNHLPAIIIGIAYIYLLIWVTTNTVYNPIQDNLITEQHSWAKERYGIEYDYINTYHTGVKSDKKWQSDVIKSGTVIATVCEKEMRDILLCVPGTQEELSVIVK